MFTRQGMSTEIEERGYSVQPLLDADEIRSLQELAEWQNEDAPSDYYVSAFSDDLGYKRKILYGMKRVFEPKLPDLVPGYRVIMGSFVTKRAKSTEGRLGLHQDYSQVDHALHQGINIWCPLIDVDGTNGCLKVIDGSHRFGHISATPPNPSPYSSVRTILEWECMAELPMAAGSAFVFDTRVLHATEENVTDRPRTAVFLNLVPEDVEPIMYFWDPERPDQLRMFAVTEDFLLSLKPNTVVANPEEAGARFIKTIDYRFESLRPEDVACFRLPGSGAPASAGRELAGVGATYGPAPTEKPRGAFGWLRWGRK